MPSAPRSSPTTRPVASRISCSPATGTSPKRRGSAAPTTTWANLLNSRIWFVSSTNMQTLKAEKPLESPAGSDPVTRLMARLVEEGFTTDQNEEEWADYGEIIYRRTEK